MKNLSKVFLLVALFLGGCSTTESSSPSDALIDLIGGKTGRYYYISDGEQTAYYFTIGANAVYFAMDNGRISYSTGTDTSATYTGYLTITYTDGSTSVHDYKIELADLTSKGGTITRYIDEEIYFYRDFEWVSATSSTSSVSFESDESYSSVVHPK